MNDAKTKVNLRFLKSLDRLMKDGRIRSAAEFCNEHGYDPGNLSRLRREPHREPPIGLFATLVSKYGVSGDWLLTGQKKRG